MKKMLKLVKNKKCSIYKKKLKIKKMSVNQKFVKKYKNLKLKIFQNVI